MSKDNDEFPSIQFLYGFIIGVVVMLIIGYVGGVLQ